MENKLPFEVAGFKNVGTFLEKYDRRTTAYKIVEAEFDRIAAKHGNDSKELNDFLSLNTLSNSKRYDDFEIYQQLCEHLWIHESKRKALFGVDDFYLHAKELLTREENLYRVEKIKNTPLYTRAIHLTSLQTVKDTL